MEKKAVHLNFRKWQEIKQKIFLTVVNYEREKPGILDGPYEVVGEFAVLYYIPFDQKLDAIHIIKWSDLDLWEVSYEGMRECAFSNMKKRQTPKICTTSEYILDLLQKLDEKKKADSYMNRAYLIADAIKKSEENGKRIYVLSNQNNRYGSVQMLYSNILDGLSDRVGENLFIMPFSVHLSFLLPEKELSGQEEFLTEVQREISGVLDNEDKLTDTVYYYDSKSKKLCVKEGTE